MMMTTTTTTIMTTTTMMMMMLTMTMMTAECAAGDFVKFNFPLAWATVVLTWGLIDFKDAYDAANQTEWMYESVQWPLDYLLKCHVADDKLYVQVKNAYCNRLCIAYWYVCREKNTACNR